MYRGIKDEFVERFNEKNFSCWSTSRDEAVRFAKHEFTGGRQFKPIFTKNPHILETEVSLSDVAIFIGGGESEVLLRNPVNIINIEKIEPGKKWYINKK